MKIYKIISAGFGITLFFLFILFIGTNELVETIKNAQILYVIVAVFIMVFDDILDSTKLNFMFRRMIGKITHNIEFIFFYNSYLSARVFKALFPIKGGEFTIIYFLKKIGIPYKKSFSLVFLDLFIMLTVLLFIASIGMYIYFGFKEFLMLLIASISLIFIIYLSVRSTASKNIYRIIPKRISSKYDFKILDDWNYYWNRKRKYIPSIFFLNFVNWIISHLVLFSLFRSLGFNVDIVGLVFVNSLTTIISIIPISPGSIGVKEISGAVLFNLILGVPMEISASAFILQRGIELFVSLIYFFYIRNFITERISWKKTITKS